MRRVAVWLAVALGALLLCGVGGWLYLLSWIQGEGFRHYLENNLRQVTQAQKVSIPHNLELNGRHMTLPGATLSQAGPLRELSIRKLHVEIDRSALLRRVLRLQRFSAEEMQITLAPENLQSRPRVSAGQSASAAAQKQRHQPTPPQPKAPRASSQAQRPQAAESAGFTTSGSFFKEIHAKAFKCHYTDTTLLLGENEYRLEGYQLTATPRSGRGKEAWCVQLENGRIRTPFPQLRETGVKTATLLFNDTGAQLTDCRVLLTPGQLSAKGSYRLSTGRWQARAEVEHADVARILADDWRKRLTGELSGSLDMAGNATTGEWEARGELRLIRGLLEGLPILSDLKIDNTYPYRHLTLERAVCDVSYPYSAPEHGIINAWLWDNIDIRTSDGSLLIRGRVITGTDGSLSGSIALGIPSKTLAAIGLSDTSLAQRLFNARISMPGYVWVQVNLSGTLSDPQEDFSVRLSTILPESLPELAEGAVKSLGGVLGSFLPPGMQPKPADQAPSAAPGTPAQPVDPRRIPGQDKVKDIINSGLNMFL